MGSGRAGSSKLSRGSASCPASSHLASPDAALQSAVQDAQAGPEQLQPAVQCRPWGHWAGGTLLASNPATCSTTKPARGAAAGAAAARLDMQRSKCSHYVLCRQGSLLSLSSRLHARFQPCNMLHRLPSSLHARFQPCSMMHLPCRRGSSGASSSCAGHAAQPGPLRPSWRLTGRCGLVARQTCSSSWPPSRGRRLLSRSASTPRF